MCKLCYPLGVVLLRGKSSDYVCFSDTDLSLQNLKEIMGDSGCRKCGEDGHFARYNFSLRAFKMIHCVHFRDCPTGGGGGGGDDKCRNCRQEVRLAWRLV